MTDATASPSPSSAGLWEDFIDILYQPSAVFDRRREGKFGIALLAIVIITAVLFFALRNGLAPVMDAEMAKQAAAMAAKNPQITPEQIAASQGMMEKFAVVGYVVFVPVGIVIIAALLWLAGKVVDAKVAFAAAMMIATYSWFPRIIEMILNAVQGLLLSPESITSRYSVQLGPARFFDSASTSPVLLTFLGGIDLFTIWTTALLAIGLSVVARVPRSRGVIAAVAIWFVMMLLPLYQALSS
ncbi:MAG TPA: YIP1 family protein [Gemmatimonadaceae bacterium]|nr:YIP1 family protein [Gemmatimonadaceae bacterium]